jgi:hypothetical protein
MNHAAQSGMTLGEVEILVGGFFFNASFSCVGVTRYELKEILRVDWRPAKAETGDGMEERKARIGCTERKAMEAMVSGCELD